MIRRSFRIGLVLGVLAGLGLAIAKALQARRGDGADAPPSEGAWPPLPPEPARAAATPPRPSPAAPPPPAPAPAAPPPPVTPVPTAGPDGEPGGGDLDDDILPTPREAAGDTRAGEAAAPPGRSGPDAGEPAPTPASRTAGRKAAGKKATKKAPATKAATKKRAATKRAAGKATAKKAPAQKAGATVERAWVEPSGDTCPGSHPIKAKLSSRIFHLPGMFAYDRTKPDRCYRDAEAAEADGLRPAKR